LRDRLLLRTVTALALLGAGAGQAAADYVLTDLGQLAPVAVNNSSEVLAANDGTHGSSHAFLYSGGRVTDLDTLGRGLYSEPHGLNNKGQAVGAVGTWSPDRSGYGPRAFLSSGGKMTDLATLTGAPLVVANAINDAGQIVGRVVTGNSQRGFAEHAFVYSGGKLTDLGTLGGTTSAGTAINAAGQVAGWSETAARDSWGSFTHAFLSAGGRLVDLGTLGGRVSYATGIDARGRVTGYSSTPTENVHAFQWSGGRMTDLGTLGGAWSYPFGSNASGEVVGQSETASGERHAFLYSGGRMTDLNSLLPADSPWVLDYAFGINDWGQIVATGYKDGRWGGVLLSPRAAPEPGALALALLGAAGLVARLRRRGREAPSMLRRHGATVTREAAGAAARSPANRRTPPTTCEPSWAFSLARRPSPEQRCEHVEPRHGHDDDPVADEADPREEVVPAGVSHQRHDPQPDADQAQGQAHDVQAEERHGA
jgi:probable HAF family extracellular repeat protein